MTSCKEYLLDDLMAICAIPVNKVSAYTSSVWALTPTVSYDFSSLFDADTIVIGISKATKNVNGTTMSVGSLIPIKRTTGKAKNDENDSVAGRLHTVKVTCEVDERDLTPDDDSLTVMDHLLTLERTPCHLLLTFRDNNRAFVLATEDTYVCNAERDGAKTKVSFSIQNIMGIQMIV